MMHKVLMTDSPSRRGNEFTIKLHFCKGCHAEVHPDMIECMVCGTPVGLTESEPPAPPSKPSTGNPKG